MLRAAAITIKECPDSLNESIWQLAEGFDVEGRRSHFNVYDAKLEN